MVGGGRAEKAEFVWIGRDARTGARTLMAAMRSWRLNGAAAEVAAAASAVVVTELARIETNDRPTDAD